MALGTRFLGHTIHLLKGQCHSEKIKTPTQKKIPQPPTTCTLSVPCAANCMTNYFSLEKPSLSCLRIFRLRTRKKECSASDRCEEVLRFSASLHTYWLPGSFPMALQICMKTVAQRKNPALGISPRESPAP